MQVGYKLRKHIGNALKARSKAIRTALQNYNVAAQALVPPRPGLSWDDIVEYAFLVDFDLLSDTRSDVRLRVCVRGHLLRPTLGMLSLCLLSFYLRSYPCRILISCTPHPSSY